MICLLRVPSHDMYPQHVFVSNGIKTSARGYYDGVRVLVGGRSWSGHSFYLLLARNEIPAAL